MSKLRLKEWRKVKNLTATELSEKSRISLQEISRYEHGRRFPGVKNLKKLAKALGISWRDLVDD